jgi:predicted GH43/DUF377 family glycosyl hydrolase
MDICDITKLIKYDILNYHCFNNGLLHYKDNIFIMPYRVIKFNSLDQKEYHPWKIWLDGYRLLQEQKNKLLQTNAHLNVNTKLFTASYRMKFEFDKFININLKNMIDDNLDQFDGTGLAIMEFINNEWIIKYNINNIFENETNHDTRICRVGNDIYVTYNMFLQSEHICHVKMIRRKLQLNLEEEYLYLYPEEDLLKTLDKSFNSSKIEKNCVIDPNNNVLFSIDGSFKILTPDILIIKQCPIISELIKTYNNSIYFSLSTPPIKFNNNNLAVGHVKIEYKKIYPNTFFNNFMKTLDFKNIKKHGKYIYFMFLFEYDDKYNILRMSNFFVPTINNNHLPYYLVFPVGLVEYNNNYLISYGEGDTKCKILTLSKEYITKLLDNFNGDFFMLTLESLQNNLESKHIDFIDEKKNLFEIPKKILHVGYFDEYNCGDDAFVNVFKWLNKKYYPEYEIEFAKQVKNPEEYKLITLGGGDVIGKYFLDNIPDNTVHAIGVGIPYMSQMHKIEKFKSCILRNSTDLENVKIMFPNKLISCFPDLVFLFDRIYNHNIKENSIKSIKPKIGFCLTRTYYKSGYEKEYISFITNISKIIQNLSDDYEIHLIPFGVNKEKITECDLLTINHICKYINVNKVIAINSYNPKYSKKDYVNRTFNYFKKLDFVVCSRFHAHIFATITNVPFVSLSCSRKCENYMKENNLEDNLYKLSTNELGLPNKLDYQDIISFIRTKLQNMNEMKNTLKYIMIEKNKQMDEFIEYYMDNVIKKIE